MTTEQVIREMESRTWFHRFEVLPGIWSPGRITVDAKAALDHFGVPDDLGGKSVIDIGALDGAYSFEFERRGAFVLAVDIQDPDRTGFSFTKGLRQSRVEYRVESVYSLAPDTFGMFDIAWYFGVFYHLREPLIGFRNIHRALKADGVLFFEGAALDHAWEVDAGLKPYERHIEAARDLPLAYFSSGAYAGDPSNWYIPTAACLREWLRASGFKDIKMNISPNASRAGGSAIKDDAFQDWEYGRF